MSRAIHVFRTPDRFIAGTVGEPGDRSFSPLQARDFSLRSERVIAAGRAPCPLCGEPLAPEGHICIRTNGYRRGQSFGLTPEMDEED
ncbi:MAG: DUF3090 family protein [Rhodococcus sp. (in: high G+C Gram-positive bacteria)]|nr:MAG: DUF3090 family protein [Rhodococcus sp. (in: high G+C Gram-positive bacteria)]